MKRKLCICLVLCLAIVFVQSETEIEVDENGDEYEVKRFTIEGRSLGDGRSQCVVSRRKRATASVAAAGANGSGVVLAVNSSDEDSMENAYNGEGNVMAVSLTSPPSNIATHSDYADDDDDYDDDGMPHDDGIEQNMMGIMANEDDDGDMPDGSNDDYDEDGGDDEENEYVDGDGDDDKFVLIAQNQQIALPINGDNVAVAASSMASTQNGVSAAVTVGAGDDGAAPSAAVAVGAASTAVTNPNGIVVVHADGPPQVNPNTHAVFALQPVNTYLNSHVEDNGDFVYTEELNPTTTTAIWSTGDNDNDDSDINYDDLKPLPMKNKKKKQKNKKPVTRPTKRPPHNKNKKIKKVNKNPRPQSNRKGKPQRGRPAKPNRHGPRPQPNRQRQPQRRRPAARPPPRRRTQYQQNANANGNANRRGVKHKTHRNNANRRLNSNLRNHNSKRKHLNNQNLVDQGVNTFTKTETVTQTGMPDDADKNVNCIVIRKDAPPTTARPFWNILGRDADAVRESGHFGNRKRANLRFTV